MQYKQHYLNVNPSPQILFLSQSYPFGSLPSHSIMWNQNVYPLYLLKKKKIVLFYTWNQKLLNDLIWGRNTLLVFSYDFSHTVGKKIIGQVTVCGKHKLQITWIYIFLLNENLILTVDRTFWFHWGWMRWEKQKMNVIKTNQHCFVKNHFAVV